MDAAPTVTLRDAAKTLARIRGQRQIADLPLLNLLRAGQITAGFYIDGQSDLWIAIPASYWLDLTSDKFRAIRIGNNKKGIYVVRPSEFADEILHLIEEKRKSQSSATRNDFQLRTLRSILSHASKKHEVLIHEADWGNYLTKIPKINEVRRSTRGRRPKEGWKQTCVILAAFLIKHGAPAGTKHEALGKRIHELATKEGVMDMPADSSIIGAVADAFKKAQDPEFG